MPQPGLQNRAAGFTVKRLAEVEILSLVHRRSVNIATLVMKTCLRPRRSAGFTLIELLVVIAILAAMLLPALGRAKLKAQGILCMNNGKQMMLAWRMFIDDNSDKVPSAWRSSDDWMPVGDMSWSGNARTDGGNQSKWGS